MDITDQNETHPLLAIPWAQHLEMVNWKIECRDMNINNAANIRESLNSSIIVSCCTIIESIITTSLKDYLFDAKRHTLKDLENGDLYTRLWKDYANKIDLSSFNKCEELITVFTGKKIHDYLNSEDLKALTKLFQFRNVLVHGNELAFDMTLNSKGKIIKVSSSGNLQKVFQYCKDLNLVEMMSDPPNVYMLNNQIANHFYEITKRIIIVLKNNFNSRINTYMYTKCKDILGLEEQ